MKDDEDLHSKQRKERFKRFSSDLENNNECTTLSDSVCYYETGNNDDYDDQTKRKMKTFFNLYDIDWPFLVNVKSRAAFYRYKHINSNRYFSLMPVFCLTSVYIDDNLQNKIYDNLKAFIQQYIQSSIHTPTTPTGSLSASSLSTKNFKINLNKSIVNATQVGFIKNEFDLSRSDNSNSVRVDYSCKYATCARNDLNERKRIVLYNSHAITKNSGIKSTIAQNLDLYRHYLDLIKTEII